MIHNFMLHFVNFQNLVGFRGYKIDWWDGVF